MSTHPIDLVKVGRKFKGSKWGWGRARQYGESIEKSRIVGSPKSRLRLGLHGIPTFFYFAKCCRLPFLSCYLITLILTIGTFNDIDSLPNKIK